MSYQTQGHHILLDIYDASATKLSNADYLAALLLDAATEAGSTVLFHHFHHFTENSGVTGVLLLAESHISIHTWPETGFAAVDIFMCGKADAVLCQTIIQQALEGKSNKLTIVQRGQHSQEK